jgi:hypothetical protein
MLVKAVFVCLFVFSLASPARATDPCEHDLKALLALDEAAFDQDLNGGGWRRLENIPGCERIAAKVISAYRQHHRSTSTTLAWHEGQMLAFAGDYVLAAPALRAARRKASDDHIGWNHYVDATLAFLAKDREGLLAARARLATTTPTGGMTVKDGMVEFPAQPGRPLIRMRWPLNLEVVDGLIRCFEKTYAEAYKTPC